MLFVPCPYLFSIHTYSYMFFPFHWLFQFFSLKLLKRYLKLLLVYFYFSFAIWVSSCQTRQQNCCFCNGRWLRSKWLVLGLKWGSQFCISCHHPELGTWLRTPWSVDCTVLGKADWQASEQTMKSQSPFTRKKASKSIKGQRWALEQSDIGFRRAVAVRLLRLSMSAQRGGLFRPSVRLGSCLRSIFKFWPQVRLLRP